MDQESIVYGCIKDVSDVDSDVARRKTNRNALITLPQADEWPYLSREMFSLPKVEFVNDFYQTEVIHFGSSYRAIEYEWDAWMQKFEELLSKMYWVSAIVHLETELSGVHTFTWESKDNGHKPGSSVMNVRCEWSQENSFI